MGWKNYFAIWLASEHPFWVHVLYFKKQPIPPPCCLAFYTEYNIHEGDQADSFREQHPLHTEQLLNGLPGRPGLVVLQTCSEETTSGSAKTTKWARPSSSAVLFYLYQFVATVGVNLKIHSLLGAGMWTLRCTLQRPLYICHSVLLPGPAAMAFKLLPRTALSLFRLAESPLCDVLTSWLAEQVPCDLQSHHILTWCVTTACLTACCGVTPWLAESMHGDVRGCSLHRCHLLSHCFAVCKNLWPCNTSTFPAVYLAAGSLWKSSVSPQHKLKTL